MRLTTWDWLTLPATRIQRLGHDPQRRVLETGSSRAFSLNWARTIGMWRVAPRREIEHVAGVGYRAATMFAMRNGLLCRDEYRLLQCDLCVLAWSASLEGETLEESYARAAAKLGILPAELVLYRRCADTMMAALGVENPSEYWSVAPQHPLERAMLWKSAPPLLEIPDANDHRSQVPRPAP